MGNRVITLGTWEGKPIEWEVLKEDDMQMLVMSVKSICSMQFNSSNDDRWKNSDVRVYLNNTFWNKAFDEKEKKQIINAKLTDVGTKDNVFLISKDEYTINNRDGKAWTRTRHDSIYKMYIYTFDYSDWTYIQTTYSKQIYPAMYIKK